jgi:creatinine amidohydrolase
LIEDYGAYEDNYGAFAVQTPKPFHERTRNGAFGDATQATQEAGGEIVEATVERAVAFAEDFILLQERQGEAVDAPRHD